MPVRFDGTDGGISDRLGVGQLFDGNDGYAPAASTVNLAYISLTSFLTPQTQVVSPREFRQTEIIFPENTLSEEVEIGSIGEKRQPLTQQNYLEVKDRIPIGKIHGVKSNVFEIETTQLSKTDLKTEVNAIVPINGVPVPTTLAVETAWKKLTSAELKLVKFSVMNNDTIEACNDSPQKLKFLIDWGNDARIVHQVFIVMDAKLSNKFDNNVNVTLEQPVCKAVAWGLSQREFDKTNSRWG